MARIHQRCALLFLYIICIQAFQYGRVKTWAGAKHHTLASTKPAIAPTQPVEADARGSALWLEGVSVYRGPNPVLRNVDWRIEPSSKWALLGSNGSGKSTLLQAIVGEIDTVEGSIYMSPQFRNGIGYLKQTAVSGSSKTVYEEAASGMIALEQARRDMEMALQAQDTVAYDEAVQRFEAMDGFQQEKKVTSVLNGLGFTELDVPCNQLSGGWQMRVGLAKLLLSEPTLCLLDEPSNHLDQTAKKWLAGYLRNYSGKGSMILVTHDVELLQSMDHIAELIPAATSKSLQIYKSCDYNRYLILKDERAAAAMSEYKKNLEKAAQLQGFVDRWGASATKASAAQSRQKQLDKMRRDGLLDDPAMAVVAKRFKPTVVLPRPPKAVGDVLLSLEDAVVGYGTETPLLAGINLAVTRGMKLLIRGPNGVGKSTILHTLRGSIPLVAGDRKANPSMLLGMFTQDLAQELDAKSRAVDLVTAYARTGPGGNTMVSDEMARAAMGRLGLSGDKPLRRICDLSGGEKARVALAMFTLKPCNLYLFDEVSNHLDVECVQALGDALSQWGDGIGAMVVVSHDKAFCSQLDFTHVATVSNGKLLLEQRNVRESDWLVETAAKSSSATQSRKTVNESGPHNINQSITTWDAELRKKLFNAPKRIAKITDQLDKLEAELVLADEKMLSHGKDLDELTRLQEIKDSVSEKIEALMVEWDELESLLANNIAK